MESPLLVDKDLLIVRLSDKGIVGTGVDCWDGGLLAVEVGVEIALMLMV